MGNIWGIHQLVRHPQSPRSAVERVDIQLLGLDARSIEIEYFVSPAHSLVLPQAAEPSRTDELWKATCFEAFLKSPGSEAYVELNFSPSFAWAAYEFNGYRAGMRPLAVTIDPEIWISPAGDHFFLSAEFENPLPPDAPLMLSLSAVIEEKSGHKSYWALAHPPEGPPDFHHPSCFVLELPPPSAP